MSLSWLIAYSICWRSSTAPAVSMQAASDVESASIAEDERLTVGGRLSRLGVLPAAASGRRHQTAGLHVDYDILTLEMYMEPRVYEHWKPDLSNPHEEGHGVKHRFPSTR